jgi:hypothetical protein
MPEEQKPSIDERIQALTMNLELLLRRGEEQDKRMEEQGRRMDAHEREWERFRRAMRAGLESYFGNGDGEEE